MRKGRMNPRPLRQILRKGRKNMSFRYNPEHPGIQMVEKMRERMPDEDIRTQLSKESTALQQRVNSGSDRLEQSHIDRLKLLEVAQTYAGTADISNPTARAKLINVQQGLSATGNALMSTQWQRILDNSAKPKPKTPDGSFTVKIGRTT